MKQGKARFYADENLELDVVEFLRERKIHIDSAVELGLAPRDDVFHLHEARRRKAVLLTRDQDFLDDRVFPFLELKETAIVVLRSENSIGTVAKAAELGYMLLCLLHEIAPSGLRNLSGLKIELRGPRMIIRGEKSGRIRTQVVDISKSRPRFVALFAQ